MISLGLHLSFCVAHINPGVTWSVTCSKYPCRLRNINLPSQNNLNFYFCLSKEPWKRVCLFHSTNSLLFFHFFFSFSLSTPSFPICSIRLCICLSGLSSVFQSPIIHLSVSYPAVHFSWSKLPPQISNWASIVLLKYKHFQPFSVLVSSLSLSPFSRPVAICPFQYKPNKCYYICIM